MTGAFEEKFQNELNLLSIELKNYQINNFMIISNY